MKIRRRIELSSSLLFVLFMACAGSRQEIKSDGSEMFFRASSDSMRLLEDERVRLIVEILPDSSISVTCQSMLSTGSALERTIADSARTLIEEWWCGRHTNMPPAQGRDSFLTHEEFDVVTCSNSWGDSSFSVTVRASPWEMFQESLLETELRAGIPLIISRWWTRQTRTGDRLTDFGNLRVGTPTVGYFIVPQDTQNTPSISQGRLSFETLVIIYADTSVLIGVAPIPQTPLSKALADSVRGIMQVLWGLRYQPLQSRDEIPEQAGRATLRILCSEVGVHIEGTSAVWQNTLIEEKFDRVMHVLADPLWRLFCRHGMIEVGCASKNKR